MRDPDRLSVISVLLVTRTAALSMRSGASTVIFQLSHLLPVGQLTAGIMAVKALGKQNDGQNLDVWGALT